ncbi:hypothetical protein Ddye_014745 [Dipteronia dyeriana]|uniref:RRM domain-containing protein n=1 Tax=Dipteronia dyeriana TaxID=168575 RepID=A0AAD9X8L8_9ROSI|nr:hypothetical protein Ddye_014745 [Dipteronia dyeriana]
MICTWSPVYCLDRSRPCTLSHHTICSIGSAIDENVLLQNRESNLQSYLQRLKTCVLKNLFSQLGRNPLNFPYDGRVRDVFLSVKNNYRRGVFAFVRFETWEEANNVANMVNGRLIFGWPIASKIASYGWSNRRSWAARKGGLSRVTSESRKVNEKAEYNQGEQRRQQSFAEVVNGYHIRRCKEGSKVVDDNVMSWSMEDNEDDWLSKCAIGVLNQFLNVSNVNSRLISRGFSFHSSYLGNKNILWCIESVYEKRVFMENNFSAMIVLILWRSDLKL